MKITRICDALGARVEGLDLSKPLDQETVAQLKQAWIDHHVLVFPNQDLTPSQQADFSLNFGAFYEHPTTRMKEVPTKGPRNEVREIARIRMKQSKGEEDNSAASRWHSDVTCEGVPPTFSILYGRQPLEMEDIDDDTCYCNIHKAYEQLSPGMKDFLGRTQAWHSASLFLRNQAQPGQFTGKDNHAIIPSESEEQERAGFAARAPSELGMELETLHPCVRIHPATKAPTLYLNDNFTDRFEGWTRAESKPLIDALLAQATKDENVYRHKWKKGDLVCWDNRSVMHRGPPNHLFPQGAVRDMNRTTVIPVGEPRPQPLHPGLVSSRL